MSQAAREIQQTNPEVLESLQRQVFQGMGGSMPQQQQQQTSQGGEAGSGATGEKEETKSSGETKDEPSSDDKGD